MGLAMAAKIEYLCFAPLSAGIFCGMQRRAQVVSVGMHVVAQFSYSGLKEAAAESSGSSCVASCGRRHARLWRQRTTRSRRTPKQ
jgi:hypothetical protein